MDKTFKERVISTIKKIPPGRVSSYGQIAALAGNYKASRQVAWILKNNSEEKLPWHRVINSKRKISLSPEMGGLLQKSLLESEGVVFIKKGTIVEKIFFWNGSSLQ